MSWKDRMEGKLGELQYQLERRDIADAVRAANDLNNKVQMLVMEAKLQTTMEQLQALSFVTDQFSQRTVRMWFVQRAISLASNDYTAILSTQASKGLDISGLFLFAAFTLLPEVGALAVVMKDVAAAKEVATAFKSKWQPIVQSMKVAGKTIDFGQRLAGGGGANGQTAKGMDAANAVLQDYYDSNLKYLVYAAQIQSALAQMIYDGRPNPLQWVRNTWANSGMELLGAVGADTLVDQSDMLRELILYDILRLYTSKYVNMSFTTMVGRAQIAVLMAQCGVLTAEKLKDIPNGWVDVDGLNGNQREMIYHRFSKVAWSDQRTRPPVNSWRDLVSVWGARASGFQTDRIVDARCIGR